MTARGRAAQPPHVRFWRYVDKQDGGCWLWTASVRPDGYGEFRAHGRLVRPHRFAYEALVGPIPEGMVMDHLCRVRHCVNPAHLEPVTPRENVVRGVGSTIIRLRVCGNGHEMTAANTYVRPDTGHEVCRRCKANDAYRSRTAAKRAAA